MIGSPPPEGLFDAICVFTSREVGTFPRPHHHLTGTWGNIQQTCVV